MSTRRERTFSGIQPTGAVHLGNYLGALRHWVEDQHSSDSLYCVVDLHAITLPHDPSGLAAATLDLAETLLAIGLDPEVCTLFVQSHVGDLHTQLAWLFECTVSLGQLGRMTQFKDKGGEQETVSAGLFTYPTLMASDIVLYDTTRVPVGDDQRQHVELTRDITQRFNARYGEVLVVPQAVIRPGGARIKDLQNPKRKMSKSADSPQGTIELFEEPRRIERKIRRAVTDTEGDVVFDPDTRPGVANLLTLLAAATGAEPDALAQRYSRYGPLKADTAAAVVEMLRPIQQRKQELHQDRAEVQRILVAGAAHCRELGTPTLRRAMDAVGFLPVNV